MKHFFFFSSRMQPIICFAIFLGICFYESHGAAESAPSQISHSLQQTYEIALKNSPSLDILRARLSQARASHKKAWSAIKPTFNFQGAFTHFDEEVSIPFSGMDPVVYQLQNQFSYNVI